MTEQQTPKKGRRSSEPAWPSLDQQLADANVVEGSVLERLIRDNQDFDLLHPHEANDAIGIPPWLRVHWRKAHPEGQYSPEDPTGGYPRVLRRTHSWMLAHQDLESES